MSDPVARELRREHRQRLSALTDRVLAMGDRIGGMLDEAMAALATGDAERATAVLAARDEVVAAAKATREAVFRTLALEAPVAGELRLVSTIIHVNLHLERMAGLAANLARAARRIDLGDVPEPLAAQIREMGVHARAVLERAMTAFARRDDAAAARIAELDDPLDQLNQGIFRQLLELGGDERSVDRALRIVLVARYLERFGDHAVAVGEAVAEGAG